MKSYHNDKITWEIAEQTNLGIETKFFGGIVELNADIYQEVRHNIIDYRYTMPASTGLEYFTDRKRGRGSFPRY